ncbi:hypothetical protein JOM56_004505 [Amanita muscaria]
MGNAIKAEKVDTKIEPISTSSASTSASSSASISASVASTSTSSSSSTSSVSNGTKRPLSDDTALRKRTKVSDDMFTIPQFRSPLVGKQAAYTCNAPTMRSPPKPRPQPKKAIQTVMATKENTPQPATTRNQTTTQDTIMDSRPDLADEPNDPQREDIEISKTTKSAIDHSCTDDNAASSAARNTINDETGPISSAALNAKNVKHNTHAAMDIRLEDLTAMDTINESSNGGIAQQSNDGENEPSDETNNSTAVQQPKNKARKSYKKKKTNKLNAEGLCANDWVDRVSGTCEDFKDYWTTMTKDDKKAGLQTDSQPFLHCKIALVRLGEGGEGKEESNKIKEAMRSRGGGGEAESERLKEAGMG